MDERLDEVATQRLHSLPSAPSDARAFVMATLFNWGRSTALPEVQVVASELVTNAVLHAGGDIDMRLALCGDRLRIEVSDEARDRPPVLRPSRGDVGNGLHIVDAIAQSWGCDPVEAHKTVWAEIDVGQSSP